jgi:hypothetical protein
LAASPLSTACTPRPLSLRRTGARNPRERCGIVPTSGESRSNRCCARRDAAGLPPGAR